MPELKAVGGSGVKRGRPSGEFDPWSTETTPDGYSEERFYCRSTNTYDHSVRLTVHLPPHIGAKVHEVVDSKHFPKYRSVADVLRDALVHRLWYLAQLSENPELLEVIQMELLECKEEEIQQRLTMYRTAVDRSEESLEMAYKIGDKYQLMEALVVAEAKFEFLRHPYDARMRDLIDRYTKYVEGM